MIAADLFQRRSRIAYLPAARSPKSNARLRGVPPAISAHAAKLTRAIVWKTRSGKPGAAGVSISYAGPDVRKGLTAVHPVSRGNRQQWVESCPSRVPGPMARLPREHWFGSELARTAMARPALWKIAPMRDPLLKLGGKQVHEEPQEKPAADTDGHYGDDGEYVRQRRIIA